MKFFIVAAVFLVASCYAASIPDDLKAEFATVKKECKLEVPDIDPDHLAKLTKHELVENDNVKKFIYCFHKKTAMQNEDGTYNAEKVKSIVAKMHGTNEYDDEVDECLKEVTGKDAVEDAWLFAKCIKPKLPNVDVE